MSFEARRELAKIAEDLEQLAARVEADGPPDLSGLRSAARSRCCLFGDVVFAPDFRQIDARRRIG
jgi:hypothetical protein